ncbi:MAG TPA: cytochrome c peroxidase [Stellaceae bacterium]
MALGGGLLLAVLASGASAQGPISRQVVNREVAALTQLGRALFSDPALSASGKLACASCHDPAHGFGPAGKAAVMLGGKDVRQPGVRAVPSLKYLQATPQFSEHYYESDEEGDASVDNGPTGGLTWDGRVDRGRDQARLPLLSPFEMANADSGAVVAAAKKSPEAAALRRVVGSDDTAQLFATIVQAFEAYEQSDKDFYPYSSNYDAYLAGKAVLAPAEARGLALFNDPAKGNCAHCHKSTRDNEGGPPQFTDYGFVALGVPRNPAIPANADPNYYDLGLCGPQRADLTDHSDYCGMFKAPSLRNVALRHVFFHNGVFHTLRQAVEFYATRDTDPAKWYPRGADGKIEKFNDLPPQYWDNVNVEPPFDRHPGDPPALNDREIDDIVAFLGTLTDGYRGGK